MPRDRHWMEQLRQSLRLELADLSDTIRGVLREPIPPPKTPSVRDRVAAFLGMPREQRLALAAQLGPEGYRQWVDSHMTDLVSLVGPAAHHLLPYFYADIPPESPEAMLSGIMNTRWELPQVPGFPPEESPEDDLDPEDILG